MLIGCGLRRAEAASLSFDHVQQRDGRWVLVDLIGKRDKVRSVPMPGWAKAAIDEWSRAAGVAEGLVFRAVNKGDRVVGDGIMAQAIYNIIVGYAAELEKKAVAPHDLRRRAYRRWSRGAQIAAAGAQQRAEQWLWRTAD